MQKPESNSLDWLQQPAHAIDHSLQKAATSYQNSLTKPLGSLGRLETIAIEFAGFQHTLKPALERIVIRVFAGDHGVCAQKVSVFPQTVTVQMIENFVSGGAAISVMANYLAADFAVVNMGTATPLLNQNDVIDCSIAAGTKDFTHEPAMTRFQLEQALSAGKANVQHCDLFIGGEMGIGNTTSASAIYCALLNLPAEQAVGPGTGLSKEGVQRKCAAVTRGLVANAAIMDSPLGILQCFGGFEIAALVGSYLAAAQKGIPILVDGFITTAAALLAVKINPSVRQWMIFSHLSAEPAHRLALQELDASPLLDLGMRLGEGSGAAVCVDLIKTALRLHNEMATFDQANVNRP